MKMKVVCQTCRRWVGGHIPKGGDGTLSVARKHDNGVLQRCPGTRMPAFDAETEEDAEEARQKYARGDTP